MADQESDGRLGNFRQGAGPRVQIDQLLFVQEAQLIVKLANRETVLLDTLKQLWQRTIAGSAGFAP